MRERGERNRGEGRGGEQWKRDGMREGMSVSHSVREGMRERGEEGERG